MSDDETIEQADVEVEPDVFTVAFACGNCGDTFAESYPAGTRVYISDLSGGAIASRDDKTKVTCPTCELGGDCIRIEDRKPHVGEQECPDCGGNGYEKGYTGGRVRLVTCDRCDGDGHV